MPKDTPYAPKGGGSPTRTAPAWAIAAGAIAVFVLLAMLSRTADGPTSLDMSVAEYVRSLRAPLLTDVMRAGSALGGLVSLTILTAVTAVWFWLAGRRGHASFVALVVLVGTVVGPVLKELVGRPRPPSCAALIEMPSSLSFPSGHALESLLLFGALAVSASALMRSPRGRAVTVLATACILWVAASRVYLGVHWATDVLASWALGVALLATGVLILRRAVGSSTV